MMCLVFPSGVNVKTLIISFVISSVCLRPSTPCWRIRSTGYRSLTQHRETSFISSLTNASSSSSTSLWVYRRPFLRKDFPKTKLLIVHWTHFPVKSSYIFFSPRDPWYLNPGFFKSRSMKWRSVPLNRLQQSRNQPLCMMLWPFL